MNEFTYEVITTLTGNQMILRSDGSWIPTDLGNTDYQAYLESLNDNSETE
jgi:hypothetical protein